MKIPSVLKFTYFWKGPFSQWHRSTFTVDGVEYNTAEQYMMAGKARLFGDEETLQKIMKETHPREQKSFGREVKNFVEGEWNEKAKDIVFKGNMAKFTQNEDLKKMLLATEGTYLVEASPLDSIWGIGLAEDDERAKKKETWKGTNWLGEVLDKVREKISGPDWIRVQHPDTGPDKFRSYNRDVIEPLGVAQFLSQFPQIQIFGTAMSKYPLYHVSFGRGPKHVLVIGGVHGDEPAGTYAALDLISDFEQFRKYGKDFTIHIYPCMNPWGYEHDTRENAAGLDLNRGFKKEIEGAECRMFADHLKKVGVQEYEFAIDFHEGSRNIIWKDFSLDDNPDGAWLYELCHNHDRRMGRQMVDAVRQSGLPVNTLKNVYEDLCHDGLVSYPEDMRSPDYSTLDSFDAFLWANYTGNAFTAETNMDWSVEDRIKAHHLFFFTALDTIKLRLEDDM